MILIYAWYLPIFRKNEVLFNCWMHMLQFSEAYLCLCILLQNMGWTFSDKKMCFFCVLKILQQKILYIHFLVRLMWASSCLMVFSSSALAPPFCSVYPSSVQAYWAALFNHNYRKSAFRPHQQVLDHLHYQSSCWTVGFFVFVLKKYLLLTKPAFIWSKI